MSTIVINGKTYSGNSIVVTNGQVIIDGLNLTPDQKEITINVEGNINELKVDVCKSLSVKGNVGTVKTTSGDVDVSGDVGGGIQTVSGDVDCFNVNGYISTVSGDIKHKKH